MTEIKVVVDEKEIVNIDLNRNKMIVNGVTKVTALNNLDDEEEPKEAPQNKNCENKGDPTQTAYKVDNSDFDTVNFLCRCSGEDFLGLVRYAKSHGNTFFRCVSELANTVNADYAYRSAIIKLARPLGDAVEKKAFELFYEAIEKDEYDFVQFWEALQTINYFCN